jgi:hypothetical protein
MKSNYNIKHKQVVTQNLGYVEVKILDAATNCSINSPSNVQVHSHDIESANPITCPKIYQLNAFKIVEEDEQALADNSLEKLNILFEKILGLSD